MPFFRLAQLGGWTTLGVMEISAGRPGVVDAGEKLAIECDSDPGCDLPPASSALKTLLGISSLPVGTKLNPLAECVLRLQQAEDDFNKAAASDYVMGPVIEHLEAAEAFAEQADVDIGQRRAAIERKARIHDANLYIDAARHSSHGYNKTDIDDARANLADAINAMPLDLREDPRFKEIEINIRTNYDPRREYNELVADAREDSINGRPDDVAYSLRKAREVAKDVPIVIDAATEQFFVTLVESARAKRCEQPLE